jgi:RNA polymerase sigma-70 factor (ECF subfamily)
MMRHLAEDRPSAANEPLADQFADAILYLRRFARSLTHNTDSANDLLQDTLAKGWAARGQFVAGTNFRAWMSTIMRHRFLDDCRRKKELSLFDEDAGNPTAKVTGPAQDAAIEFEEMAGAYWQLAPNHRQVLMLVGALGLQYEEAAGLIGCAVGTVRSRLSRARNELQNQIEKGAGRVSQRPGKSRNRVSRPLGAAAFMQQLHAA